jgi:hypothetical protein
MKMRQDAQANLEIAFTDVERNRKIPADCLKGHISRDF